MMPEMESWRVRERNQNDYANYKKCKTYKGLQQNSFPPLKIKTQLV